MDNKEIRWGGEFGSGRLVTPEVWEIITVLTSPPEEQRAGVEKLYAKAVAWLNGCTRPEHNIGTNPSGALENAHGDGRNSFLYGVLVDLANRKIDRSLYDDLVEGSEIIPQGVPIEADHVPSSYRSGGKSYGFARSVPYGITSRIWKAVDAANDPQKRFLALLSILEEGIAKADNLGELVQHMEERVDI